MATEFIPAPPTDPDGVPPSTEPEESIADHRQAVGQAPPTKPPATPDSAEEKSARDAQGRFQPGRHRAKSQTATPEDTQEISALAKRIKDAEMAAGADIVQKPGESNRVFELRCRAELIERKREAAPPPTAAVVAPVEIPPRPRGLVKPEMKDFADFDQYLDARDQYNRETWQAEERVRQDNARITSVWASRVTDAEKVHADFDLVALGKDGSEKGKASPIPAGSLMDAWILESDAGAHLLYALHKDDGLRQRIAALPPVQQAEALAILGHQLMSKYSPGRPAAAAPVVVAPAPRPPTPIKTGPMRTGEELPGDDASLADHRKAWMPKLRR